MSRMSRMSSGYRIAHRQTGAALVIGLLLLLVLTVLGIAGANTSSLSLIVAGNAQYSQNSFELAENGIERSIAANDFNPDPNIAPETQQATLNGQTSFVGSFLATSRTQLGGVPQPALPGASLDSFSTYHFEIDSTGTSRRGATARHIQALAVIAPADSTVSPILIPGEDGSPPSEALE